MPLYIGSTKISDIVLTDSNGMRRDISEARISNDTGTLSRAVFPDSVGAPLIEEFNLPTMVGNAATGFTVSVTIVGTEDATYELTPSEGSSVDGGNTGTIPASGTVNRTWRIEASDTTSSRNLTLDIAATGSSSTEGINRTRLTVNQNGLIANPISLSGFPPDNYLSGSPVAINVTLFGGAVNSARRVSSRLRGASTLEEFRRYTYTVSGAGYRLSSAPNGPNLEGHFTIQVRNDNPPVSPGPVTITISRPGYTSRTQTVFT